MARNGGDQKNELSENSPYVKKLTEDLDEALNSIEVLKQEKYILQLNLDVQTQTALTQSHDLESYMKQLDILEEKIPALDKENSVLRQRVDNLSKEKQDLEKSQEVLTQENSALKVKLSTLQQQLETYQNTTILNETVRSDEIHPDVEELLVKIKTLEDSLGEVQCELESSKQNEKRLTNLVRELEEGVVDRDQELSSQIQRSKELQESMTELQCEIETLKLGQLDVNKQGNSMFAELDDRRKTVEQKYKELSKQYLDMLKNYEENKKDLTSCKGQLAILSSMTGRKHQEDQIKRLRQMLSEAVRKKDELTEKLCKAIKNQQELSTPKEPVKGDQYNYLRILNEQAHQKNKQLENETMAERQRAHDFEKKLINCNHQLYACQESYSDLKSENLKLKQQIKDLTSKPDVHVPTKPKLNIEIEPGFESDPECQRLVEQAIKENMNPHPKDEFISKELMMTEDGFVEVTAPRPLYGGRLGKFNSVTESTKSKVLPKESALKVPNIAKEEIGIRYSTDKTVKPVTLPDKRKVDCAQQ